MIIADPAVDRLVEGHSGGMRLLILLAMVRWAASMPAHGEEIASGLTVPIAFSIEGRAAGVLKIRSASVHYAQCSFFTIALRPQLLLEGITLELRDPDKLDEIAKCISGPFGPLTRHHSAKLTELVISNSRVQGVTLVSEGLESIQPMTWKLRAGLLGLPDGSYTKFSSATLIVSGLQKGTLQLQTEYRLRFADLLFGTLMP